MFEHCLSWNSYCQLRKGACSALLNTTNNDYHDHDDDDGDIAAANRNTTQHLHSNIC